MQIKTLNDLKTGEGGKITQISGGHGMVDRLASLDIRPGKKITKLNSAFLRGPVTIEVDRTRLAIGFGMAKRILVETGDNGQ